jgi:hypothetical protein
MKTKPLIKNTLFKINLGIVIFLSIGASYFTIIPMILWNLDLFHVIRMATQNGAMIGLWIVYFASIVFLYFSKIIGGVNEN